MDLVLGPGPYFDGPSPWTGSTEGVLVLYFPVETLPCQFVFPWHFLYS